MNRHIGEMERVVDEYGCCEEVKWSSGQILYYALPIKNNRISLLYFAKSY